MIMKLDELDKQILRLLAQNGRLPSSEIARTVEASERTVTNRVNSLIESGVISIIGVINEEQFGYEVTADIHCQVDTTRQEEIAQAIAAADASFLSFGEFSGDKASNRIVTFKVRRLDEETVRKIVEPVVDEIIDIRTN